MRAILFASLLILALPVLADEPVDALTVVLVRSGPNPGDESKAVLFADGKTTLHSVRMVGVLAEKFDRSFTLAPKALAAFAEDLERLHAFDLPPLAEEVTADDTVLVTLELKRGERTVRRSYAFRHLQQDLPDLAVIRHVELYTGIHYWMSDHLLARADEFIHQKGFPLAMHYGRLAVQVLDKPYPDDLAGAPEDPVGNRLMRASDMEKHGDVKGAHALHVALVEELRGWYAKWMEARGISGVMERVPARVRDNGK